MKGLYRSDLGRWDYERYTRLYNKVYSAVKSARPDANIGGPYVVVHSIGDPANGVPSQLGGAYGTVDQRSLDVIKYWLANKTGAQFITIDAKANNKDGVVLTSKFGETKKFADITNWIKDRTNLPIWYAEDEVHNIPSDTCSIDPVIQPAVIAMALYYHVKSGAAMSLRWQPQAEAAQGNCQNLFTDTRVAGGGKPYENYYVYEKFHRYFPPGTQTYKVTSSSSKVAALASQAKTLLINKTNATQRVNINGILVSLNSYQVLTVDTPSATDTVRPIVSIILPTNKSKVKRNSSVAIQATATDNVRVASVKFYINSTLTCTDTAAPYACDWIVPSARAVTYTILAKAIDASGNTGTHSIQVTSE